MNDDIVVSVIMSVRDGEEYLSEAIESILSQTFKAFEFIIVNDASTDRTEGIVLSFNDPRVKYIKSQPVGLPAALNKGLAIARGKYIARMDADDIALPERFEKQIAFLRKNQDIDIICSNAIAIDSQGNKTGELIEESFSNERLSDALFFRKEMKPVIHPSVMFRKSVYEDVGGYREYLCSQDSDYWRRCLFAGKRFARKDILLKYRIHDDSVSSSKANIQKSNSIVSVMNCFT